MSNRAFETLGKRRIGIILGGAMVLGAAVWIASIVGIPSSSPRMGFIYSRFTLPQGWSAGPITRTGASQFRAATDTRTVYGPDGFHIQLTYTPGVPNAGNFGWIPPGLPDSMLSSGESRLSGWSSPYRLTTWTSSATKQGYFAGTIVTLHGTYDWTTSIFSRTRYPTLYQTILRWANAARYSSEVTPTEAVHAMMAVQRLRAYPFPYTKLGPNAWFLASGIAAVGTTPDYWFATHNHGKSWTLIHTQAMSDRGPIALRFFTPQQGWMAQSITTGDGGSMTLYTTHDGGRHWRWVAHRILPASELISALSILQVDGHRAEIAVKTSLRQGHHWTQRWPTQWMVINQ